MRLALLALLLATPAAAQTPLETFGKDMIGRWQRVPVPALAPFGREAVDAALARCAEPVPHVSYAIERKVLLRLNEDGTIVAVGFAAKGEARNGLQPWAIATDRGDEVIARARQTADGSDLDLAISDAATLVRCPAPEAETD